MTQNFYILPHTPQASKAEGGTRSALVRTMTRGRGRAHSARKDISDFVLFWNLVLEYLGTLGPAWDIWVCGCPWYSSISHLARVRAKLESQTSGRRGNQTALFSLQIHTLCKHDK